jgi:hypothetical protein
MQASEMLTANPPPGPDVDWLSYGDGAAAVLAVVLVAVAVAFAYLGTRVRAPIGVTRPGRTVSGFMIAIWLLAIYTFIVALGVTHVQMQEVHLPAKLANADSKVHIATLLAAALAFFAILFITRRFGWRTALASAVIGTGCGPMFFELPFDLIVIWRTYPPIPPSPPLYRQLVFLPLFAVEFSTIALLALLPSMRITGKACYALAAMFAVFAVWAVFGFAFPTEPALLALNIVAKLCCFLAAIMLFVWDEDAVAAAAPAA